MDSIANVEKKLQTKQKYIKQIAELLCGKYFCTINVYNNAKNEHGIAPTFNNQSLLISSVSQLTSKATFCWHPQHMRFQ